jgi:hypothetical protein
MFDLDAFLNSDLFAGLTISLLVTMSALIQKFIAHKPPKTSSTKEKSIRALYSKLKYWRKNKSLFNEEAVNLRSSWSKRTAENPPRLLPTDVTSDMATRVIGTLSNIGIVILVNFVFSGKAFIAPFDFPPFLRPLLQNGLSGPDVNPRAISVFGAYFILNLCSDVFVSWIPMAHKLEKGIQGSISVCAEDFIVEESKWELENVEKELGDFLDKELKKLE